VDIPAADIVVADTVGAGDAFMAALLSELTRERRLSSEAIASLGADELRALGRFCALAAGVTCSRRGPILPTAAELEQYESR
jgi:fructokinase